jgi:catechol 2,3-dioxygenase-like lactoylglutathione lyase family enzyme
MAGIVFLSTRMLESTVEFYTKRMGMKIWLEQEDCTILRHGDLALGFCQRKTSDICGIITFWHETKEEVDRRYEELKDIASGPPTESEKYRIYHFFLRDPEGRTVEVQKFLDT